MDFEDLKKRLKASITPSQQGRTYPSNFVGPIPSTSFRMVTKPPIIISPQSIYNKQSVPIPKRLVWDNEDRPSTQVGFTDVAKEIPGAAKKVAKSIFNFGKDVLQGTARSGASVGATISEMYGGPNQLNPETKFERFLYGDQPVKSLTTRIQEASPKIREKVKEYTGKDLGRGGSTAVALPAIVGMTALDFWGGGKTKGLKALAEATKVEDVIGILKKSGMADDVIKKLAPQIAKTSDTKIIEKLLASGKIPQEISKVGPSQLLTKTLDQPKLVSSSKSLLQPTQELVESGQKGLTELGDNISSFYNLKRLNISNEAKQAIQNEIDNAGDKLSKTVGKTLTNKEVVKIADVTKSILDKTVTRQQTAEKIAANLKLRQKIAQVAQNGRVDDDFINLWIKDKAAGEDIARQLQARRINADPKEMGIIDLVLDAVYKVNKNADEVIEASKGVDFNDAKQVTDFYRKFVKPKASEWVDLLRYNSMLTSPNTHIVNIASNFEGTGLLAPLEKTVTGLVDATRAALNGKPRQYAVGEGAAYAKGYYSNISKATQNFIDVMRGDTLVTHPDLRSIPLATGGVKAGVEKTLNFPLRLLEGMDQFFTTLTEGGLESASQYAAKKGITRTVDIAGEAAQRVFRGGSENQGHILNAIDGLTNLLMQARKHENPILSTISKFTLPFIKTPTEILKQGIEYSPLGLTTLWGATNKTEQLSKVIIGAASAAGAATLLGQDRLTWAEPTGAKEKAEFRAAGRQPYSVKIGDHWVSYSKLHPALAFNFALIANLDDAIKKRGLGDSDAEIILSAFARHASFLADQSYLKNIGDFVAATKGDLSGYSKLVSNYPQQLIPFRALSSWIERITDPVQRQADPGGSILDKQMQYLMSQIPGLAQQVPERRGPLGEPIENQNRVFNAFSPSRVTTEEPFYESIFELHSDKKRLDKLKQDLRDSLRKEILQDILR